MNITHTFIQKEEQKMRLLKYSRKRNILVEKKRSKRGITLVSLIITIIILMILAGISINLVLGENGLYTMAIQAKEDMEQAQRDEEKMFNSLYDEMENMGAPKDGIWEETEKVNTPRIEGTGLIPVKIGTDGSITEVKNPETEDWYNYEEKQWANAKSTDGSLWVWIPRFAYKITQNNGDNSQAGSIDVVFLKGTSNEAEEAGKKIVTSNTEDKESYIVHPAFRDGTSNNFANGEWDREIPGFWIAKFEAGYVGDADNPGTAVDTGIKYTTIQGTVKDGTVNTSYYYGTRTTETTMKYPTFQANRPSYNNISMSDSFILCKNLTASNSPFQLQKVDSHLIKNSEWGAVTYLSWSKYGQEGIEITVNNVTAGGGSSTIFAVTGYGGATTSAGQVQNNLDNLLTGEAQGNWASLQGYKASTTGNISGVYDMSGGAWERTAGLVSNGHTNLLTYGKALLDNTGVEYEEKDTKKVTQDTGESTKYVTIYPHDTNYDNGNGSGIVLDTANQNNFKKNTSIYGDAIRETTGSHAGTTETDWYYSSWNGDFSLFPGFYGPFTGRGGRWSDTTRAGAFAFNRYGGGSYYHTSFRAVLVPASSLW